MSKSRTTCLQRFFTVPERAQCTATMQINKTVKLKDWQQWVGGGANTSAGVPVSLLECWKTRSVSKAFTLGLCTSHYNILTLREAVHSHCTKQPIQHATSLNGKNCFSMDARDFLLPSLVQNQSASCFTVLSICLNSDVGK